MTVITLAPIGEVRTARTDHDATPVQSRLNWEEDGELHLDAGYRAALDGVEGFTHLWLVTWLARPGQRLGTDVDPCVTPFLLRPSDRTFGVFATRTPNRPNPIGLHLVRVTRLVEDGVGIAFRGVDMVDRTPVLDIKPWVAAFDVPPEPEPRAGWFDGVDVTVDATPDQLGRRVRGRPPPSSPGEAP